MRLTRSQFVIRDKVGGGNDIIIACGDGVFEKKEGFRSRTEAEDWVKRALRKARLEKMEETLFTRPWLPQAVSPWPNDLDGMPLDPVRPAPADPRPQA